MSTPVVFALGILLALRAVPGWAGRGGGAAVVLLPSALHTVRVGAGVAALALPDTTRRTAPPNTTQRPALVPDTTPVPETEVKPTRKTTLLTVLAIAVLTVSTLLLYNVRSR